jgi:lipid II:glycine glycyltransferase (peptidoglycan interpeptide bridge formation enzyme)
MTLTLRVITSDEHAQWVAQRPSVSFLQVPEWAGVKLGWRAESLGWFDGSQLVGAGLMLYRGIPKFPRRSLAYLPEGPDIDWQRQSHPDLTLSDWLTPLIEHARHQGAFQIKMGPPVPVRQWAAAALKSAMAADPRPARIGNVPSDWTSSAAQQLTDDLRASDWVQPASAEAGFGDVQPRFVFQLSLADRSLDDVMAGFNQLWRRNIRKAEKSGVTVSRGSREDLTFFHPIYVETAARDGFTPRALPYFERMWDCLNSREPRLSLHLARYDGHLAAATLMVRVGDHAWYSYGASTTADRDVRPSNALQWDMITLAHQAGCSVYDLRGISDTLDPDDHLHGLVQFKLGSGGYAQEYVGEWDYVTRPLWARAFHSYQSRRG